MLRDRAMAVAIHLLADRLGERGIEAGAAARVGLELYGDCEGLLMTLRRDGREREVREPGGHVARRGIDLEGLKDRFYPSQTIETSKETLEWLQKRMPPGIGS